LSEILSRFLPRKSPIVNQNQVSVSLLVFIGRLLHPASERAAAKWNKENPAALELIWPVSGVVDCSMLMGMPLKQMCCLSTINDSRANA
jgi:hypothetical protein